MPELRSAAVLSDLLADALAGPLGRGVRVAGVSDRKLHTGSTHPLSHLEVRLTDGRMLPMVLKRLHPQPDRDVRRELAVYRNLLSGQRFGAPILYGWRLHRDEHWLLLEDVGHRRLDTFDVDVWEEAFRWMAVMHADYYGRGDDLRALGCLAEHDAAFHRALAEGARRQLAHSGQTPAFRRFGRLMEGLDEAAAVLAAASQTLIHGDLSCKNLMVQPGPVFRPLDWEWAAVGLPAWDVSKLLAGWGPTKPRLLEAYLGELDRRLGGGLDRRAFQRDLGICRAMHALWYLRWWIDACEDPPFVDGLLDKIERAWNGGGDD